MPLLKANEPLPQRAVVIGYYGEPGVKKTSIAHTSETPLLIDFDRGVARSYGRKDAIIVDNWEEVLQYEKEGLYKKYKTVIIDTAKAALDDFLMIYVVRQDFKLQKNKLQAYGAIGDEFKRFLNQLRTDNVDVIIIAHAKKDEDTKKMIPDITGQSYNLMLRVSDQIGFVSTKNNKSVIEWTPSDVTVGKNTANLKEAIIPDKSDPAFNTFMADIIASVKQSIVEMSEAQQEALEKTKAFQDNIEKVSTIADLTSLLTQVNEFPAYLQTQLVPHLQTKGLLMVKEITNAKDLNAALKFFKTKPMNVRDKAVFPAIKAIKDAKGMGYDDKTQLFIDPAPKEDLKKEIPGESIMDEKQAETLQFN